MLKKLIVATGMLALASAASATDLHGSSSLESATPGVAVNWNGIYVGGQVGYGTAKHDLSATATEKNVEVGSAYLNGIGGDGAFGGLNIGADIARGNFVFGIFGDYNFSGIDSDAGVSINNTSIGAASIKEGDSWMVGVRAGMLFGSDKRALLYGLLGYGQTDVKYGLTGTDGKDVTYDAFIIGAGGEYALTNNIFLGIEGRYWYGGEKTLFNDSVGGLDNLTIKDDCSKIEVMARLKFKLNSSLFGY